MELGLIMLLIKLDSRKVLFLLAVFLYFFLKIFDVAINMFIKSLIAL